MELPRLEPIWNKYKEQGFTVVALEYKRDTERATKFIEEEGLTYHLLENGEGDAEVVKKIFGINWFPTSFLIDRQGKVIFKHVGFEEGDEAKIEAELEKLLALEEGKG